jgi:ATPase subunit of ABC transporter with duplicated ATPase domains
MKRILLTLTVIVAGLSAIAHDAHAQNSYDNARATRRQDRIDAWHKDMAEFRARSAEDRRMNELADSIASIQARAALANQDFVLEADNITFKNGMTAYVNSNTNFISVKGNRAVVQISPSNFASGPNGVGGVTVDGMITDQKVMTDSKGRITFSMNVMGIGINAQVEIYMYPNSNRASATVYPNFNSNTVWLDGTIVPYESSDVIEGSSL